MWGEYSLFAGWLRAVIDGWRSIVEQLYKYDVFQATQLIGPWEMWQ